MPRRSKIAFSIDSQLLARVEKIREHTGESRSTVIGRAIERLTQDHARQEEVARYVAAYRERPETAVEIRAARQAARQTLRQLAWDEP